MSVEAVRPEEAIDFPDFRARRLGGGTIAALVGGLEPNRSIFEVGLNRGDVEAIARLTADAFIDHAPTNKKVEITVESHERRRFVPFSSGETPAP